MSSFTITTHQIWSCHVTLATNFESFLPNSILYFRKSYQIWGKLAQEEKLQAKNQNSGWRTPSRPLSAYRVKIRIYEFECHPNTFVHVKSSSHEIKFWTIFVHVLGEKLGRLLLIIFDSWIIRRMMCDSMLLTNAEIAPMHCWLSEPDCLSGIIMLLDWSI